MISNIALLIKYLNSFIQILTLVDNKHGTGFLGYHTWQWRFGSRGFIFDPGEHWNSCANCWELDKVPTTLSLGGLCASSMAERCSDWGVEMSHHTWANERKNNWLSVRLSPGSLPCCHLLSSPDKLVKALKAALRPPLSAMFSPSVWRPLMCSPEWVVRLPYSVSIHLILSLYACNEALLLP